ncbi:unnamed protein product [Orchesella dallaii]|uniref:C2H2-type domain-containing protein n=1 Tax=Orchesella dallaii TaxID=48710 RepID=A0ABP1RQS5_9HEXA
MPRNPFKNEEEQWFDFPKKGSGSGQSFPTLVFQQGPQSNSRPWVNPNRLCPECKVQFNQTDFRRTKETCGHVKCRSCLVKSDDGCFTCEKLEKETRKVNKKTSSLSSSSRSSTLASLFATPQPPAHVCAHCENGNFDLKRDLEVHLKEKHNVEMYHACDLCHKVFTYKEDFERHKITHGEHPFKCSKCNWEFLKKMTLERHLKNIHKITEEAARKLANEVEEEYLKTLPLPVSPEKIEDLPQDDPEMFVIEIREEGDQAKDQDLTNQLESMSVSLRMCLNVK